MASAIGTSIELAQLIEKCGASRPTRRTRYAALRLWYSQGTDRNVVARYNKLDSHIELIGSYLYAPESTRFTIGLPAAIRKEWAEHLDVARDEFVIRWRDSGADVLFSTLVEWSLVYGATVAKVLPDEYNDVQVAYVHPADIGVLREDVANFDQQEVVCHWFSITLGALERMVRGLPHADKIMSFAASQASPGARGEAAALPSVLQQVVVSNINGTFPNQNFVGVTDIAAIGLDDRPVVEEPLVELVEVWEKADFNEKLRRSDKEPKRFVDYMVTTMLGEYVIIPGRRNPVLPRTAIGDFGEFESELPFIPVVPKPLNDYVWGKSHMISLVPLQAWREDRMNAIDTLLGKQLDPPRAFTGVMGSLDEKLKALRTAGSYVSIPGPGVKMETLKPEMPEGAFQVIDRIDDMFNDAGGVPGVLHGDNQAGIRAGNQFGAVANVASGRIRKRALVTEDSLEVLGTRMFHMMQRRDATHYVTPGGKRFLLAQIPSSSRVKVSAHSSSPVYAEQIAGKADRLLKAGAVDLPDYVDLVDPPMREALKEKARVLAKNKAEMAKLLLQAKLAAAQRGKAIKG